MKLPSRWLFMGMRKLLLTTLRGLKAPAPVVSEIRGEVFIEKDLQ